MFTSHSDRSARRNSLLAASRLRVGALTLLIGLLAVSAGGAAETSPAAASAREKLNAAERRIARAERKLAALDSQAQEAETLIVATRKSRGPVVVDLGQRGKLRIEPDDNDGDKVMIGESLTIEKDQVVEGDAVSIGGNVTILGKVMGDVVSVGGTVELGDSALVGGDAVSVGGSVNKAETALVGGEIVQIGVSGPFSRMFSRSVAGKHGPRNHESGLGGLFKWLVIYLIMFAFAALTIYLARDRITYASDYMSREPFPALLLGLLSPVILLVAFLLLCITLIGIPVAVALLLLYPAFVFLGWVVAGHRFGMAVRQDRVMTPLRTVFVGLLILNGLHILKVLVRGVGMEGFFPFMIGLAGFLVSFVAALAGLGAIIGTRFRRGPLTPAPAMGGMASMPPVMPPPSPTIPPQPTPGS